jgi:hypothetical protein
MSGERPRRFRTSPVAPCILTVSLLATIIRYAVCSRLSVSANLDTVQGVGASERILNKRQPMGSSRSRKFWLVHSVRQPGSNPMRLHPVASHEDLADFSSALPTIDHGLIPASIPLNSSRQTPCTRHHQARNGGPASTIKQMDRLARNAQRRSSF